MSTKKPLTDDQLSHVADALLWMSKADREIREPAEPPKRWERKIIRHQSARQRIAESQTKNPIRAAYTLNSQWNELPVLPDGAETDREVGPGDRHNPTGSYRAGKETQTATGKGTKRFYRNRTGQAGRPRSEIVSMDQIMAEYEEYE